MKVYHRWNSAGSFGPAALRPVGFYGQSIVKAQRGEAWGRARDEPGLRAVCPWPPIAGRCSLQPLRSGSCFVDERIESSEPPVTADVADRGRVGIGVARQQFHDVGVGLRAAGIEFECDEVGKRHDPQVTAGPDDCVGRRESAVDDGRKPAAVVHNLNETEGASDIDDASEWIFAVWLPNFDVLHSRSQGVSDTVECVEIGIHAEVEIFREPHVAVSREGDRPDHHGPHALRLEHCGDLFGGLNQRIGVGH